MRIVYLPLALVALSGLGGCASPPPTGPTVLAVPGPNKTWAEFQTEDATCRTYAQTMIGPTSPSQAAVQSGVGSAVVGTALGAAAGAAIGAAAGNPAAGAAIGAGTGLVVGAGAGSTNAAYSGAAVQRNYDISYIQCMVANGDKVQSYPTYAAAGPGPYSYLPLSLCLSLRWIWLRLPGLFRRPRDRLRFRWRMGWWLGRLAWRVGWLAW